MTWSLSPLGDAAILLSYDGKEKKAADVTKHVVRAARLLEGAQLSGVVAVTSAFRSIALFLDDRTAASLRGGQMDSFAQRVQDVLASRRRIKARNRSVRIPVCFDFALDLERIEEATGLRSANIVRKFLAANFTVGCLGFMPGFPYLLGLPKELKVARLSEPRLRVSAGSVAIAGGQAGIYSLESPGGWNIIGRTPLSLFDLRRDPPALLSPGDRVRFRRITRGEFDRLA